MTLPDCLSFRRRNAQQFGSGFLDIVVRNIGMILTTRWFHNPYGSIDRTAQGTRLEEVLLQERLGESTHFHRQPQLFLSVYVDDTQNDWTKNQTPLIDQVCSACTQRESVTNETNVKSRSDLFAKIALTDTEVLSNQKTSTNEKLYHGVATRRVMQKNAWNDFVNCHKNPWINGRSSLRKGG